MLNRTSQIQYQLEQMVDAAIAAVAFTLAIVVRRSFTTWWPETFVPFDALWNHAWLYMLLVPLWIFLLDFVGFYQHRFVRSYPSMVGRVVRANIAGIVITFFLLYFLRIKHIPRMLLLLFASFDIVMMLVKETLVHKLEPKWSVPSNILLVGAPSNLRDVLGRLRRMPRWKANLLGILVPAHSASSVANTLEAQSEGKTESLPILGSAADLAEVLHREAVDCVLISPGQEHFDEVQKVIATCETEGVEAWLATAFVRTSIARTRVDEFQDLPLLVFSSTPALSWALMLKRMMDIVGALILIVLFSPVMLLSALLIKLTSPGPILFKQERCTLHGRVFRMFKFRTMVSAAEQLRNSLEEKNEMEGPVFKMKNDPRITRVGRFLRRHSLDELPQLFNVLSGDMSLVGPRPPIPGEVAKYENWQRRRLSMRAGITCLWQISGRNNLGFDEWMQLDLQYIDNWSLELDLAILVKTPLAMINGTGY